MGRLTRDPELRSTAAGMAVCSIRLAVTSRTREANGDWGDKSNYFDVTVFGKQAETAGQYLAKGRRIGVDGRLSFREWQTDDGARRQAVEVVASDVYFLDSRRDEEPAPSGGGSSAPKDDGIPF